MLSVGGHPTDEVYGAEAKLCFISLRVLSLLLRLRYISEVCCSPGNSGESDARSRPLLWGRNKETFACIYEMN